MTERLAARRRLVRVVAVASRTGAYGGPFDTSVRQAGLAEKAGYDAVVVAGAFPGDEPDSDFVATEAVRHVMNRRSFTDVFSLRQLRALRRHIATADVVHISVCREPLPLAALLLARLYRVGTVAQPHGMLTGRSSAVHQLFDALVTRRLLGRKATVIALTDTERRELLTWWPRLEGRIRTIGNPPPPETVGATPLDSPPTASAVFIARLHPRKRVADFLAAGSIAESKGWRERYVVVGPDEGDLHSVIDSARRSELIEYAGATDSAGVIRKLKESAVFVLPARNEPWGNVLVAALTLCRPVVVTESSALAPLVHKYAAGVVVPDEEPEKIAHAVHELLEPSAYARHSRAAAELAAVELSPHRVSIQLAEAYEIAERSPETGRSRDLSGGRSRPRAAILGSHSGHGYSMRRYSELLAEGYRRAGFEVLETRPSNRLSRRIRSAPLKKFITYVENVLVFPLALKRVTKGVDVVHIADHSDAIWVPLLSHQTAATVTCHDLIAVRAASGEIQEHYPRWSGRIYQRAVLCGLRRAAQIVAVSDATADDVRRFMPSVPVTTVHNPLDPTIAVAAERPRPPQSEPRYALIVSSSGWRKRRERAIAVWSSLRSAQPDEKLDLIVVGPSLTSTELHGVPQSLRDSIDVRSAVTDAELADLYASAFVLIQMSQYEGFGWPVIEANAFGVPAICSMDRALQEIGAGNFHIHDGSMPTPDEWRLASSTFGESRYRRNLARGVDRYGLDEFARKIKRLHPQGARSDQ